MKLLKETDRIYYYLTKDKEPMIAIKFKLEELSPLKEPHCLTCNSPCTLYYFCPELGFHSKCYHCFRHYKMESEWDQLYRDQIFNILLTVIITNTDKLTEEDLDIINLYFREHSHRDKVDVRKFIKNYGKDIVDKYNKEYGGKVCL